MTSIKELWDNADPRRQDPAARAQVADPAEDDYLPPVTSVKLPSRGIVYDHSSPLYMAESVDIMPVSAKEENILASQVLIKSGKVFTALMRSVITNKGVDPDRMLTGDRNAILIAIRVSAYGSTYTPIVQCPGCRKESKASFDLSRLEMRTLEEDPVGGPGSNEFTFKMPSNGRLVHFKLLDAVDLEMLERDQEAVRKKTGQDQAVTLRLHAQITKLQGVSDPKRMMAAIEALPAADARALRIHMDRIAPGVDMDQVFECPECGDRREIDVPMGPEFFWPSEI